jgi:hypothetical protein
MYHGQLYARVDLNPKQESTLSPSQGLRISPQACCNFGIGSQTLEPPGKISSTTPTLYFHLFTCILVGLYRSGSASRMILVRSGIETFTGYKHRYTQGKRIAADFLSSFRSECIFSGLFILLRLTCTQVETRLYPPPVKATL